MEYHPLWRLKVAYVGKIIAILIFRTRIDPLGIEFAKTAARDTLHIFFQGTANSILKDSKCEDSILIAIAHNKSMV